VFLIDAKKFNKEVSEDVKAYLSNLKENAVYIANNNKTKNTKVFLHTFEWEILKNLIGESNV
jgi:predicted HAD superfamily phosphohydrolase YqeG